MNGMSYLLLVLIGVGVFCAVRTYRRAGSCSCGSSGDCGACCACEKGCKK